MAHFTFSDNLVFTFTGELGDLHVHSQYRSDGIYGVLTGEVTIEKCQHVAIEMGYIHYMDIGEQIYEAWKKYASVKSS